MHPYRPSATTVVATIVGIIALAACADPVKPPAAVADAVQTAGASDAAPVARADVAAETSQPVPWVPPPVAPADSGTDVAAGNWLVASVPANNDLIYGALASGQFTTPAAGDKAYGASWKEVAPKAGQVPAIGQPNQIGYAVRQLPGAGPTGLILQLDRVYDAWLGGRHLPGDVYGHGPMRFAGKLPQEGALLVVRGRGGQPMNVQLWTTAHAAKLSPSDHTQPDLRVGDGGVHWLGVPLLVPGQPLAQAAVQITARVVADMHWQATAVTMPGLVGGAVTQLAFELQPKAPPSHANEKWPVQLRIDSPSWPHSYALQVELPTAASDVCYRQTFLSPDDGSVQYYGVRPPVQQGPNQPLVLSVHGAGVDAIGQAQAYHAQPTAWIAAPTNRRPFGFDWEEWGHWNGLYALEDAAKRFVTDPARQYLTGHSMGGHGTWQLGVHHSDRFAVLGPSAGWGSFYTYTGVKKPTGAFARARAHSDTHVYLSNLANGKAVYVIHGTADDNVPFSEGKAMHDFALQVTKDVGHHWEQGAGHWWDGDKSAGADCVDWPELFAWMAARTVDPVPLNFKWKSPAPWYASNYAWLHLGSAKSPNEDCTANVKPVDAKTVQIGLGNVRSLWIDAKLLRTKGIETVIIDGQSLPLPEGVLQWGPTEGKRPSSSGPYNQAYHKPFVFVYPDGDAPMAATVAYMASNWMAIGNGQAAALPISLVTEAVRKQFQLIHFGVPSAQVALPKDFAFQWGPTGVTVGGAPYGDRALVTVYDAGPDTPGLGAALWAPPGKPWLLDRVVPFSSRSGLPDYLLFDETGVVATGFFDAKWQFDPGLGNGW